MIAVRGNLIAMTLDEGVLRLRMARYDSVI
jgi:hypothetical protein